MAIRKERKGKPVIDPAVRTRCRKIREAVRWSREELADTLGVSVSAVEQWETGNGSGPNKENMLKWLTWCKKQAQQLGWV